MNDFQEKKHEWYRKIYEKPTNWYKLPDEYIDYSDSSFWEMFIFVINRLNIKYKNGIIMIDAQNHLSEIPKEYRTPTICLMALIEKPSTTYKNKSKNKN